MYPWAEFFVQPQAAVRVKPLGVGGGRRISSGGGVPGKAAPGCGQRHPDLRGFPGLQPPLPHAGGRRRVHENGVFVVSPTPDGKQIAELFPAKGGGIFDRHKVLKLLLAKGRFRPISETRFSGPRRRSPENRPQPDSEREFRVDIDPERPVRFLRLHGRFRPALHVGFTNWQDTI